MPCSRRTALILLIGVLATSASPAATAQPPRESPSEFVRVSPRDSRYFELTDGSPYVPIGFNLVGPPEAEDLPRVVDTMARHGVNYCRIWLDQPLWSVEHRRSGEYDDQKARQLDAFLDLCRPRGIRVKMCMEWFRTIPGEVVTPSPKGTFPKVIHHRNFGGDYDNMRDFIESDRGREQFRRKIAWYAARYGDDPTVFAWELWNEMNAVRAPWYEWTQAMLPELQRRFPKNLAVQSLGSFDRDGARDQYRLLCELKDNDVLQVHRYLDLGAALPVCHGPLDLLAADAVNEIRAFGVHKPIILTETGGVRPKHTGPIELYDVDRDGAVLHDLLFAPFFAGAAGPGHVWFWRQAVDTPNHWRHFLRFRRAIEGIDPPSEAFEPHFLEHGDLRIYVLRGKQHVLAWCRDGRNDWRSEFEENQPPQRLANIRLDLADLTGTPAKEGTRVSVYDPWLDEIKTVHPDGEEIELPPFVRSVVVRAELPTRVAADPPKLSVAVTPACESADGKRIEEYCLTNTQGMEVTVLTLGAMLTTVKVPDRDGKVESVTLHLDRCEDYVQGHPVFGSTIGRYANRIAGAEFAIDGVDYPLTPNSRGHHIHGGKQGFQKLVWEAEPIHEACYVGVRLTHRSPDGHEGYPGNLDVQVEYRLNDNNELAMVYTAETDKPTHVNLTNHAYWNLAGATHGNVLDQVLMIDADAYLPSDDNKIPTGEIRSVEGTVMDFRAPTKIGARIGQVEDQNYDHCYVLGRQPTEKLRLVARAVDEKSGRVMEVLTTQPGVQLYTAKGLSDRYQADGVGYQPYSGFCLETQNFPNAPNEPSFPSSLLRPGETYRQTTIHRFSLLETDRSTP